MPANRSWINNRFKGLSTAGSARIGVRIKRLWELVRLMPGDWNCQRMGAYKNNTGIWMLQARIHNKMIFHRIGGWL